MKPKIELKRYIRYTNGLLYIQDVTPGRKSIQRDMEPTTDEEDKIKEFLWRTGDHTKPILSKLRERIKGIGEDITERPLGTYIGYSVGRNFAELVPQKKDIKICLDIPINELEDPKNICEDISETGSWGTGDVRLRVSEEKEIDYTMELVSQSYNYYSQ